MIEKKIHYIWLGPNQMSLLSMKCIESWRMNHPNWEIIIWNEKNIPKDIPYVNKALSQKKYAFASDCLRVYILNKYGGVYLDTDMEIIKPLDSLINEGPFLGFEDTDRVSNGIMALPKEHWLASSMLDYYNHNVGIYKAIPLITSYIIQANKQKSDLIIYPEEFFYPYNPFKENALKQLLFHDITHNTHAIHHWGHSWKISIFDRIINKLRLIVKW